MNYCVSLTWSINPFNNERSSRGYEAKIFAVAFTPVTSRSPLAKFAKAPMDKIIVLGILLYYLF